jgi:hypothetical protein
MRVVCGISRFFDVFLASSLAWFAAVFYQRFSGNAMMAMRRLRPVSPVSRA